MKDPPFQNCGKFVTSCKNLKLHSPREASTIYPGANLADFSAFFVLLIVLTVIGRGQCPICGHLEGSLGQACACRFGRVMWARA